MESWILILTLMTNNGEYNASRATASIESVEGFGSRQSCLVAANLWLKQMGENEYNRMSARAMCVRK